MPASNIETRYDYISTVDFINQRIIDPTFYEKYPGQGFVKIWDTLGKWKPIESPHYEWAEEDWIHQAVSAGVSVPDPTAGVPVVVTLSPADHTNAGKQSYPRLNQLVQLKNKVFAQVTAKSTAVAYAHTLTLTPIRATDNIGALTLGDKIIFITNAYAAGTDQGKGLISLPLKFSNNLMIIKEDYEFDSTQGLTKSYLTVEGPNGEKKTYYTYKGEKDTFMRFQTAVGLGLLTMNRADDNYAFGGGIVRTTEGLLPFIRSGGNLFNSTGFSASTMDDVIKKINKQKGAKVNLFLQGINLSTQMDNSLSVAQKYDMINYEVFSTSKEGQKVDGKERAVMLGFDSFKKQTYDFHFTQCNEFSEPNLLGAQGFGYEGMGVIIPMDQRKIKENGKDVMADSLTLHYLAGDGYSRKYEHWVTGAGTHVETKTGGLDQTKMCYRCEVGFKGIASNRFVIIED